MFRPLRGRAPSLARPALSPPAPLWRARALRSGACSLWSQWLGNEFVGLPPHTPIEFKESRRALAITRPSCRARRGFAIAFANASPHPPRDTMSAAGSHCSLTGAPPPPEPPRLPTVGACALCVPLRGRLRPRRYRLRNVALPLSRLVCLSGRSSGQARRAYTFVSGCSGMAGSCALYPCGAAKTSGASCFRCAPSSFCPALGRALKPRSA